jgi:hypothetical protein
MINRVTGELDFSNGLRVLPHASLESLSSCFGPSLKVETHRLSHKDWKRHVLGFHGSEHGNFEVEALSAEDECIHVVLLSHWHPFYDVGTPEDAERRAFHDGVISSDLGGQREFAWGEVLCRLEQPANKDWLIIAYNRESKIPLPEREVILHLRAHECIPDENT